VDWSERPTNGKKVLYVVRVNNYLPELCALTFVNIRAYAEKIEAEFQEITDRKFPDFPPTYEKMQVYELGRDNDWNILVDADLLLHPAMFDVTQFLQPDHVGIHSGYKASDYLKPDKYYQRDGRDLGIATGFVITSNLTHDLWTPLEYSFEHARARLHREHIADEFCIGRNVARFGLKVTGVLDNPRLQHLIQHVGVEGVSDKALLKKFKSVEVLLKKWGQTFN